MGNISSAYWKDVLETTNSDQDNAEFDSETTPNGKGYRLLRTDPRSPSGYISRTPIQVEKTPKTSENSQKPSENYDNDTESPKSGSNGTDGSENAAKGKKLFDDGKSRSRQPLKTIYGTRIGSPFSYLRHKQVQNLRTELEKERETENLPLNSY